MIFICENLKSTSNKVTLHNTKNFSGHNAPGKPNQALQSEKRNGERLDKVILNLGMLFRSNHLQKKLTYTCCGRIHESDLRTEAEIVDGTSVDLQQ